MTRRPGADAVSSGTAPTRVCLGGEDLDWIGGPALLTAIDLPVAVRVERQPASPTLSIRSEGALPASLTLPRTAWTNPTGDVLELTRLCWEYAAHVAREAPVGGTISIQSSAPPGAGLASSATTCVAALRALLPPTAAGAVGAAQLVRAAFHVERELAGRPVGPMDFVPAVFGGTTLVRSESERITELTRLPLPADARFLVVDTRTPRDTGAVIAWKRDRLGRGEPGIRHYAERMPELVDEQAQILGNGGDLEALGQALDIAQTLLASQLAMSTPLVDVCAARLRAHGALGVKLTGTGFGGCLFALTTAGADNDRLAACLTDLPVGARLVAPVHSAQPLGARPTDVRQGLRQSRR